MSHAALAERHPVRDAALRNDGFGLRLGHGVMIMDADLDRVAGAAPMDGRVSASGFSDRADVDQAGALRVRDRMDRVDDIAGAADIDLRHDFGREAVGQGRHQRTDMQHDVGILHPFADRGSIVQVAPDDFRQPLLDDVAHDRMRFFFRTDEHS